MSSGTVGQEERKNAAFARLTFNPDSASMQLDELLG
jgi:hypothetical protein